MTITVITRVARTALISQAKGQFIDCSVETPAGDFLVEFQPSTIEAVEALALQGETLSDTIIRICATQKGYN